MDLTSPPAQNAGQPAADEDAVEPVQRYDVGHSAYGDEVEDPTHVGRLAVSLEMGSQPAQVRMVSANSTRYGESLSRSASCTYGVRKFSDTGPLARRHAAAAVTIAVAATTAATALTMNRVAGRITGPPNRSPY